MKTKPLYLSDRDRELLRVALKACSQDMNEILQDVSRHERPHRRAAHWLREDLMAMLGRIDGMDTTPQAHASGEGRADG